MTQTITWKHCFINQFVGDGPVLEIKDDVETYCATIPGTSYDEITDACRHFGHTYDLNGATGDIVCFWSLWEDAGEDAGEDWDRTNGGGFKIVPFEDGSGALVHMG